MKLTTLDLPQFVGITLQEVYDNLQKEGYKLAGKEELDYVLANPNEFENMKDGNWHYFFGATFRSSDGRLLVPCVDWRGSEWLRDGLWLSLSWHSYHRVVLLEKEPDLESRVAALEEFRKRLEDATKP